MTTIMWSLVILLTVKLRLIWSFECQEQGQDTGNSCHCELSGQINYKYDIFCPYVVNSKVHFKYEPDKIVYMTCSHGTTLSEVISLVSELNLGNVPNVKIINCPVPVDPVSSMLSRIGLNISNIEWMQMSFASPQSDNDLQGYHFRNLTGLRVLSLTRMNIKSIDKTFFEEITQIRGLDLTQNRGIQIDGSSLAQLTRLEEFTCHTCFLTSLEGNMFEGLTKLRMVSLHDNRIDKIVPGTFDTNTALENLNLARNKLQVLPEGIFANNVNLTSVSLSYNNFQSFPAQLFKFNKKMKSFELSVNGDKNPFLGYPMDTAPRMTMPGSMFPESLEEIRILWVPMVSIPEDFLQGCTNLVNVTIQSSLIPELPEKLFRDSPNLKLIDFSANKITSLPVKLFSGLKKVETIRFIANKLTSLDEDVFIDQNQLKVAHLDENLLETLPDKIFSPCKQLEELDLSQNKISFSSKGDFTKSHSFHFLKKLDLSYNNISYITTTMSINMLNLKSLNLSHNIIGEEYNGNLTDIQFIQNNKDNDFVVDLSHNKIKRLLFQNPLLYGNNTRPINLNITNNPLTCDCKTVELKQMLEGTLQGVFKNVANLVPEDIKCDDDNPKATANKYLKEVDYRELDCDNGYCTDNCRCSLNRYYRETHIDCSSQAMTRFPSKLVLLPGSDTISLDMNNNRISNISFAVEQFYNARGNEALHYGNITKLYLSYNQIKYFHQECLPSNLSELYLDHNEIESFRHSDVNYFDSLVDKTSLKMKLGSNPYICDCDSTTLYHFIRNRGAQVTDRDKIYIQCEPEALAIWSAKLDDFCTNDNTIMIAALCGASVLILILIFIALSIYKKEYITIWIYAQPWGKRWFSEDIIDKEKPYDAFISYSQTDSDYVENSLLPGLENPEDAQHKFKCLIHTRDWNVGEMIPDQIIHSVESSRRTIIVLSKSYIDSMWTKLEFRAAHKQALQDRTQRVIIVVLGELPPKDDMEEDLQKYISLNTYLDAKDPWFWQKLR